MLRPVGIASTHAPTVRGEFPLSAMTVQADFCNTKVVPISELNEIVTEHLSITDNTILAMTSWFHQKLHEGICNSKLKADDPKVIAFFKEGMTAQEVFRQHPECRKDEHVPRDEKGRTYLRSLHIGGPVTYRQIANGTLTIKEALVTRDEVRKGIYYFLLQHPLYYRLNIGGRKADGVIKYCIDGALALDVAAKLSLSVITYLNSAAVQINIDNDSLAMAHAIKLTALEQKILFSNRIQKNVADGRVAFKEAIKFSHTEFKSLDSEAVQMVIELGLLSYNKARTLTSNQIYSLKSSAVQECIKNGSLSIEDALKLSEEHLNTKIVSKEIVSFAIGS